MNPRERVITALNDEMPDRCPMQISIIPEFAVRLGDELLTVLLEQDVFISSVGWANSYYRELDTYTDEWGVGWKKVWYDTKFGRGFYTGIVGHPLADPTHNVQLDTPMENFRAMVDTIKGTACSSLQIAEIIREILQDFGINRITAGKKIIGNDTNLSHR